MPLRQKAFPRVGSPPAEASIWLNLVFSLPGGPLPPLCPTSGTLAACHPWSPPAWSMHCILGRNKWITHTPGSGSESPLYFLYWPQNINIRRLLLWLRVDFCMSFPDWAKKKLNAFFPVYAILHLDRKRDYHFWNKWILLQDIKLFKTNISDMDFLFTILLKNSIIPSSSFFFFGHPSC